MPVERESITQSKIITTVRNNGGYIYKNAQSMFTETGRPDLTLCIPTTLAKLNELHKPNDVIGLFCGIEVKRPGNLSGVSESQKIVAAQIKKAGGMWFLLDDADIALALMVRYKP